MLSPKYSSRNVCRVRHGTRGVRLRGYEDLPRQEGPSIIRILIRSCLWATDVSSTSQQQTDFEPQRVAARQKIKTEDENATCTYASCKLYGVRTVRSQEALAPQFNATVAVFLVAHFQPPLNALMESMRPVALAQARSDCVQPPAPIVCVAIKVSNRLR